MGGHEITREFVRATTETSPVAGEKAGLYSFSQAVNLLYVGNTTGEDVHVRPEVFTEADAITDGDFPDGAEWAVTTGWSITGGKAVKAPGVANSISQTSGFLTESIDALDPIQSVLTTFTVSDWAAGTVTLQIVGASGTVSGTARGADGTFKEVLTITANEAKTFLVTANNTLNAKIDDVSVLTLGAYPSPGMYTQKVDDGSWKRVSEIRQRILYLSVWVPTGGTVANLSIMGRKIRRRRGGAV